MTEKKFRQIYPPEVIELMLQRQEEQGNPRNIKPFLNQIQAALTTGGFNWTDTIEGFDFWNDVLYLEDINVFYKKYPKSSNNKILLLI
jgi:hypothetical protein